MLNECRRFLISPEVPVTQILRNNMTAPRSTSTWWSGVRGFLARFRLRAPQRQGREVWWEAGVCDFSFVTGDSERRDDPHVDRWRRCPLTRVKISVSWAVQNGNVVACFSLVHDDTYTEVQDTNNETARSLYQVL